MENADTNRLELAEVLARRVHSGQVDKSGAPYVEHCRRVAAKLTDELAKVVAWLHDVLEDTDTSEAELRSQFGDEAIDAVVALTRISGEAPEEYYARVRANELALQVKLADIADNLDPERLAVLEPATAARLMQKYDKALQDLTGE
jgi:(p)ppGpp synthase/HD superfamily hydrolase